MSPDTILSLAVEHPDEVLGNASLPLIELENALMHKRIVCTARISKMARFVGTWDGQHTIYVAQILGVVTAFGWIGQTVHRLMAEMAAGRPCWIVAHELFKRILDTCFDADMEEISDVEKQVDGISRVIKAAPKGCQPTATWDW